MDLPTEGMILQLNIPKDCILILSGVPCVGKTTTAYNILRSFPEFRRVSELDIIRTVVRSVINTLERKEQINKDILQKHYSALFKSLSEEDLSVAKQQSKLLIPYVREIVSRQQKRKIPTIIEGTSIVPSTYFCNGHPINGFENNVIFINLYLSDENEHIQRRISRCKEREYSASDFMSKEKIIKVRREKNHMLHYETMELSQKCNKVFSIDVAKMNQEAVVEEILRIVLSTTKS